MMRPGLNVIWKMIPRVRWREVAGRSVGPLVRLGHIVLIIGLFIAFSIIIRTFRIPRDNIPNQTSYDFTVDLKDLSTLEAWDPSFEDGEWNVFAEMHAHTTESDGSLDPENLVEWARAYAFNVLVVSDHNTISGGLKAQAYAREHYNDSLLVIPAVEYTCCRIHMNLIGINETIDLPSAKPTDEELRTAIDRTHALGGVVIVNHLPWSNSIEWGYHIPTLPDHPFKQTLTDWGVDGFESLHGNTLDLAALRWSERHGMPLIASSDMHFESTVPNGWTIARVESISESNFLDALRTGKTSFLSDATGPPQVSYPPANSAYDKWAPLLALNMGFLYSESRGMYSFTGEFCHPHSIVLHSRRIVWFVFWGFLAWGLYEALRAIFIFLWEFMMQKIWRRQPYTLLTASESSLALMEE